MEYLQILKGIFIDEGRYHYILKGLGFSLGVTVFAAAIGMVLGIIFALFRLSRIKFLERVNIIYVDLIRGTPAVVQLMVLANVIFIGDLRDTPILIVAALAFGINSGAYISEIIRAGIEGLDKGQMEAARSLGMNYGLAMKEIILPQAIQVYKV